MIKIKFVRISKNMSQKELAKKTSVPASVISYLENGAVKRICEELDVSSKKAFEEVETD